MFSIKYKIFNDFNDVLEKEELHGESGYFQIRISDKEYGFFSSSMNLESLETSIYCWIRNFTTVALSVNKKEELFISDLESFNTWIGIRQEKFEFIQISKVKTETKINLSAIESENNMIDKVYEWTEKVDIDSFINEIIKTGFAYLEDIELINVKSNKYIYELRLLLEQLKNRLT